MSRLGLKPPPTLAFDSFLDMTLLIFWMLYPDLSRVQLNACSSWGGTPSGVLFRRGVHPGLLEDGTQEGFQRRILREGFSTEELTAEVIMGGLY